MSQHEYQVRCAKGVLPYKTISTAQKYARCISRWDGWANIEERIGSDYVVVGRYIDGRVTLYRTHPADKVQS